jgi:hypothetical protein
MAVSFQKGYEERFPDPWDQRGRYSWPDERNKFDSPGFNINSVNAFYICARGYSLEHTIYAGMLLGTSSLPSKHTHIDQIS